MLYSQWLVTRDFQRNAVTGDLTQNVQREIAMAHLWFEELLGGDRFVDIERDVYNRVDIAEALVVGAIEGIGPGVSGGLAGNGQNLAALSQQILEFEQLLHARLAGRESNGGIGGEHRRCRYECRGLGCGRGERNPTHGRLHHRRERRRLGGHRQAATARVDARLDIEATGRIRDHREPDRLLPPHVHSAR